MARSGTAASPLKPIAGIQDVMAGMIDPAADFLWGSVSTTVESGKTVGKQPRTDEEWEDVRRQAIAADRASFNAFAQALRDVGAAMLTAADTRNPQGIIDAGDTLDQVCEGCHLKFWYPGQNIPQFPDQAPEADAPK